MTKRSTFTQAQIERAIRAVESPARSCRIGLLSAKLPND